MKKEFTLDVRVLPPQEKHRHIFEKLENLAAGEDLILLNDHDPKPLFYQMQQLYPDVFGWAYLQEGEDNLWKIRIFHKPRFNKSVREVVMEYPPAIAVLKKYRIDFCCKGDVNFLEACAAKGLNGEEVLAEIRSGEAGGGSYPLRFQEWKMGALCHFIENNHHSYIRKNTPQIAQLLDKVTKVHYQRHPFLLNLNQAFYQLSKELMEHLEKEEGEYFPMIKEYERTGILPDDSAALKEELKEEHSEAGKMLEEIRALCDNYQPPAGACASFELVYKFLKEYEEDLHQHIHLENNILFPRVKEKMLV